MVQGDAQDDCGAGPERRYRAQLVGTEKRTRQKELRTTRLEEAKLEAEKNARRRRLTRTGGLIAAVVVVVLGIAWLSSSGDETVSSKSTTTTVAGATTTSAAAGASTTSQAPAATLKGPGAGATLSGDTPCPKADGSSKRTTKFAKAPPTCIDAAKTYIANFETSKGKFAVTLDAKKAPKTVNNFVVLARYHFYDGIPFHRIVPDFVIQGGDPSDSPTGNGDPGYSFADELPAKGDYKVGSIAMANSGPDTNGSQFFIITGSQGVALPPSYSLFGQVSSGQDVVDAIGKAPVNGQTPTEQIDMTKVTITEK